MTVRAVVRSLRSCTILYSEKAVNSLRLRKFGYALIVFESVIAPAIDPTHPIIHAKHII